MRRLACLAPLALTACLANEVDNPREYYVLAEHDGPEGTHVYEGRGRLRCTAFECTDSLFTDDRRRCTCNGHYRLMASHGLTLEFPEETERGRLSTGAGNLTVRYRNTPGEGWVSLSRSRSIWFEDEDFALDLAGGFEIEAGENRLTRGVFYSMPGGW